MGDDLVSAVMNMPDEVPFAVAQNLRSRLISRADDLLAVGKKKAPAIGKSKQMVQILNEAIDEGLKNNPQALDLYREANRLYREGSQKFNSKIIRSLIRLADPEAGGDPGAIVKKVLQIPGKQIRIRTVREAAGEKTWKQFQGFFLQDLFAKNADGIVDAKRLDRLVSGRMGYNKEGLLSILDKETYGYLKKLSNAFKISQAKQAEGTGKIFIQLKQAAAAGGIIAGVATDQPIIWGSAGVIMVAPWAIGRIF
ncbi:MAG: hypothetical protein ACFFCW_19805, partial [Candidatus Hodarchaeota archaeon]